MTILLNIVENVGFAASNGAFFLSTVGTLGGAGFLWWNSKISNNRRAAKRWTLSFDIVAHEQRFRGERSKELYRFHAEKSGLSGYRTKSLYRTLSGRYFEIEVFTELSEVISWQLEIIDPIDAHAFLDQIGVEKDSASPTETRPAESDLLNIAAD